MMCELFTIGTAVITVMDVVAVAGTALSVMGTMDQAQNQKDQLAYQAQVEQNKATIREQQAVSTEKRGKEEANRTRAGGRSIEDRALVTMAGQGGDVTSGSNVDLLAEIPEGVELDAKRQENNADRNAHAIRVDATNATANSIAAQSASNAINPLMSATTTALNGIGKVGAQWYARQG